MRFIGTGLVIQHLSNQDAGIFRVLDCRVIQRQNYVLELLDRICRLGLSKAKYYALTGSSISGKEAARIELINESVPLEELDDRVQQLAESLTRIPLTQLISMKLIVNQAYDNMGLQSTQTLGPILDGIMRNTPEGRDFVNVSKELGVKEAVIRRESPWGDYSQAPKDQQPRKRSELR